MRDRHVDGLAYERRELILTDARRSGIFDGIQSEVRVREQGDHSALALGVHRAQQRNTRTRIARGLLLQREIVVDIESKLAAHLTIEEHADVARDAVGGLRDAPVGHRATGVVDAVDLNAVGKLHANDIGFSAVDLVVHDAVDVQHVLLGMHGVVRRGVRAHLGSKLFRNGLGPGESDLVGHRYVHARQSRLALDGRRDARGWIDGELLAARELQVEARHGDLGDLEVDPRRAVIALDRNLKSDLDPVSASAPGPGS